jgi:hypothetical protein
VRFGSAFAGIGGFDLGCELAGMEGVWQIEIEPFCRAVLATHFPQSERYGDIRTCRGLTSSVPASHARIGRSRDRVKACQENVASSFTSLRESCTHFDPLGSSSRMFPDFSVVTTGETLRKSSGFSWSSAGMGFNGACLTASFSESPSAARVCSLSDILEPHVPQRFYLSPRACKGVLRRAEKRGRTLPSRLQEALTFVATLPIEEWKTILTSLFCNAPKADTSLSQPLMRTTEESGEATSGSDKVKPSYWDYTQTTDTLDCSMLAKGQMMPEKRRFPCVLTSETIQTGAVRTISLMPATEDTTHRELRQATILLVRRLTPTECELLQGFPLGWTLPATGHWAMRSRSKSLSGLPKESLPTPATNEVHS